MAVSLLHHALLISKRGTKADSRKGLPVILTKKEEYETWLTASVEKALKLLRLLADKLLRLVATGEKKDAA